MDNPEPEYVQDLPGNPEPDALKAAQVWSAGRFAGISHGDGALIREQLASGIIDTAIIYHAEQYGAAVLPAVCALAANAAVPPYTYIEQTILTANILDCQTAGGQSAGSQQPCTRSDP